MKQRERARLLKRRLSPLLTRHEREFPQEAAELSVYLDDTQPSLAEAINRMSDADLDRALAEGKGNGLYETFRRLKATDFDEDYARLQSPEYAKLAREAERTLPPPRFRKFGKPHSEG